jgi:hypothetical protein
VVGVAGIEPATSCSQTKALSGRLTATPLLYFTGQRAEGQDKGHVRFEGLVHIGSVLPVTQVGPNGEPFGNYQFSASLMPLDDGRFPRDWIASRWDPAVPLATAGRRGVLTRSPQVPVSANLANRSLESPHTL